MGSELSPGTFIFGFSVNSFAFLLNNQLLRQILKTFREHLFLFFAERFFVVARMFVLFVQVLETPRAVGIRAVGFH
jgi:hypothetical protein